MAGHAVYIQWAERVASVSNRLRLFAPLLSQSRFAPNAVADAHGLRNLRNENHPVSTGSAAAYLLHHFNQAVGVLIGTDHLQFHDVEITVALVSVLELRLEILGLMAVSDGMNFHDRDALCASLLQSINCSVNTVPPDVGFDLFHSHFLTSPV